MGGTDLNILFLCVANSARSQMTEGLGRFHLDGIATVMSAGSKPSFVHPLAISTLQAKSIDIRNQTSKAVQSLEIEQFDLVITLCHDEVCPMLPAHTERMHWPTPDPANNSYSEEEMKKAFMSACNFIEEKILGLKRQLVTGIYPKKL